MTGRGSTGNYSGFGDVFRAEDNPGGGYWGFGGGNVGVAGGGVGGGGGGVGGVVVPGAGPGPVPGPENVYYHQHQQANQMANRLQQMAMEENGSRYRRGRYEDYEECEGDYGGNYGDRGGMKRQMNSQGGNRGKKNRGGWNR